MKKCACKQRSNIGVNYIVKPLSQNLHRNPNEQSVSTKKSTLWFSCRAIHPLLLSLHKGVCIKLGVLRSLPARPRRISFPFIQQTLYNLGGKKWGFYVTSPFEVISQKSCIKLAVSIKFACLPARPSGGTCVTQNTKLYTDTLMVPYCKFNV